MSRYLIWDFDGTLAYRHDPDGAWSRLLVETLDLYRPGHAVTADALRPSLQSGFPWHLSEPHPELSAPGAWWEFVEALFARVYERAEIAPADARELAGLAHRLYVDHLVGWTLFDDVIPVLSDLTSVGWSHLILSNHVPELRGIVGGLGIGRFFERVVSSAETGYEKPHPQAFAIALAPYADQDDVWMIGDSYFADISGAEAVGLRAILVRRKHPNVERFAPDLYAVGQFLCATKQSEHA